MINSFDHLPVLQRCGCWKYLRSYLVSFLFSTGLLSLNKINTEGFPNPTTHTELNHGVPALRRATTTTAAGVNRKHLLEHPLVKETVAYWQGALDVVNEANSAKVASQVCKNGLGLILCFSF